jgi:hypothetical protein
MKGLITFTFFIGMFFIVSGIYEQKYQRLSKLVRTEYKFVPRSMYEDALATPDLTALYSANFDLDDPWYNRTAQDTTGLTWYDKNVWDPKAGPAYIRNPGIATGALSSSGAGAREST